MSECAWFLVVLRSLSVCVCLRGAYDLVHSAVQLDPETAGSVYSGHTGFRLQGHKGVEDGRSPVHADVLMF